MQLNTHNTPVFIETSQGILNLSHIDSVEAGLKDDAIHIWTLGSSNVPVILRGLEAQMFLDCLKPRVAVGHSALRSVRDIAIEQAEEMLEDLGYELIAPQSEEK